MSRSIMRILKNSLALKKPKSSGRKLKSLRNSKKKLMDFSVI